ncbi:MAG: hypothetical protein ACYTHM_05605 [Planctomycetota bacterium]|jgi:hypothetical protein
MAIQANVEFKVKEKRISAHVYPTIESPLDFFLYALGFPLLWVLIVGVTTGELKINHRPVGKWRWNFARTRTLIGEMDGKEVVVRLNLFERNAELFIDREFIEKKALKS